MADFEAPSFSLGLDCDLFDSEPQIAPQTRDRDPSSSNQFSVAFATFKNKDDEFGTLVVDDSEPEYPDSHPKLKAKAELHSTAVIDYDDILGFSSPEDRLTDQHLHTQHHVVCTNSNFAPNKPGALTNQPLKRKQHLSYDREPVSTSCNNMVFPKLIASPVRGFQPTDFDSGDPYVRSKCIGSDSNSNLGKYDLPQHVTRMQNVSKAWGDFPKAYHYLFHDDPRIQELVRSRLRNFFPLGNMLNVDLEQPGTSKIDYMGQFSFDESSKQAARTIKDKKGSTSRKISKEMSQGWVNPKLGVDKVTTKGAVKRKVHAARQPRVIG